MIKRDFENNLKREMDCIEITFLCTLLDCFLDKRKTFRKRDFPNMPMYDKA
jgi:hypothetical protein